MSHRSQFRPDIEGLRGIAVLIVVAFHCGVPGAAAGFIGVDVFFVLSGYLITGLLVREIEANGRINLKEFYARRMRRLMPAAVLVTLVTLTASALLLAPQEITRASRAARATSVYLTNVFFSTNAADYFSPRVHTNPLLHMWSLAVEEQFYLFWPWLLIAGLQWWRSRAALVGLMGAMTIVSFAVSLHLTYADTTTAFYWLHTRAWEFGIGGLAVLLPVSALRIAPPTYSALGWIGLAMIGGATAVHLDTVPFPGWVALPPVVGTAAVMVAAAGAPHGSPTRVLTAGPLQFLGKHSYSWYLWHWPFLVFAQALLPTIGTAGKVAAALAALGVAVVAHRLVENPLRFHPMLVTRPAASIAFGGVLSALTLGAAALNLQTASWLAARPEMRDIASAVGDYADMPRETCVTLGTSSEVKTCTFGEPGGDTTIALFGDSHAVQWFNAFKAIAERRRWRLVTVLKSGCPAYDFVSEVSRGTDAEASCRAWRLAAFAALDRMQPAAVVVGSATLDLRTGAGRGGDVDEWAAGVTRTFDALKRTTVLALRDTPWPRFDVPTCHARAARHTWYPGGECAFERPNEVAIEIYRAEQQAASHATHVRFLDFTDVLCGPDSCPTKRDGLLMYTDDNHLAGTFAKTLASLVEQQAFPSPSTAIVRK